MLKRLRLQCGEGELEEFDPDIGSRRGKISSPKGEEATSSIPFEGDFLRYFMRMKIMVEEIYQYRKRGEKGGPSHAEGKKEVGGEEPPKSPPSSQSYLDGSLHSQSYLDGSLHSQSENKKEEIDFNVPQLKLDIKFELPMYNGELNAEKLDNWIRQIEFYYRIQKFTKDNINIKLDSL